MYLASCHYSVWIVYNTKKAFNTRGAFQVSPCFDMQATILDLTTSNRSSLGEYANHLEAYASTAAKIIVGLGAVVIIAFLNSLLGRRRRT